MNTNYSNVQRTTYNNFLKSSKITKGLLMVSIFFSSNYLYSQGNNWKLDGNNNLNTTTFLGSTNNAPLLFRTNNQNRLSISGNGNFTFHTLSGNSNALMLLNSNGEASRLNFTQNNNDVLTGNGNWQSINSLLSNYWQLSNAGLYTAQPVVVNNTITATGIQILHKIEADTIKGLRKLDINGNIILGEDGAYKGITARVEDLNINSKPGFDFNTILNANTNGNVGIGTSNPTKKLDVNGDARISGALWANTLEGNTVSTQQLITHQLQINDSIKVGLNSIWIGGADLSSFGYSNNAIYTTQDPLLLQNQYTSDNTLINPYSGRVGIGVENPSSKFEVWDPRIYGGTYINCNTPIATIKGVKGASNQCNNATVFAVELKPFIGITGTEDPLFAVNNNGYVGIGTNSPERNLHVKGNTPCVGPNCPQYNPNDPLPATTYLRIEDNITDNNGNSVSTNKWDLAVSGNQNRFFIQRANAPAEALTILNNNNIGVGTTNPQAKFHILHNEPGLSSIRFERPNYKTYDIKQSTGTGLSFEKVDNLAPGAQNPIVLYLGDTGNVGIGNLYAPIAKLHIKHNGRALRFEREGSNYPVYEFQQSSGNGLALINISDNENISIFCHANSSVGIGTTDVGSFKLAVEGMIGARELKLTNENPWPDYVFANNYALMSIEQVEAYIKLHNHLPGIPSAKEIKENNGVEVGEMQRKMLEKIEELYLYVISLKEENEKLKEMINKK